MGWASYQIFKKGGQLDRVSILRRGAKKRGGRWRFYIKKLESEIFNYKKDYEQKVFSVITKNLNLEILTKNLAIFKRWDEVTDDKF